MQDVKGTPFAIAKHGISNRYREFWRRLKKLRSPIIAGFNGGFLMHAGRSKPERLAFYAGMGLAFESTCVPAAFLLNETDDLVRFTG